MNFCKSTLAMAMLSAASHTALAGEGPIQFYGKANVSVQVSDEGGDSFTELQSNASRLGVKGTHEVSNGLFVVYKAEFQVDLDGDGDTFKDRNQYIGLKGSFGEVLLGKNDTMLKQSQGKVDLFNDLEGDIKHLWKGDNRMDDTVSYKTPKMNGFQVGVTYVADQSEAGDDSISAAVFYGDKKLKKSKLYASVAADFDVKGYDVVRATVQGKVSGVVLGAMIQNQENVATGADVDGYLVSAKYKMDKVTLKGQYQLAEYDNGVDKTGFSVGADYSLAKSTKLYTFYTTLDMDNVSEDQDYLAAGIEYKF